ncbi:hypothetical protein JL721_828 [Aureococcus anophagefferens]|nr:hypothetical protein JL721_828 [Aureococcus anophagefferens]
MSWGADVAEAFGDALDAELADALLDSVDDVVDDALASQLDEISGGGGCVVVDVDARDPVFVAAGARLLFARGDTAVRAVADDGVAPPVERFAVRVAAGGVARGARAVVVETATRRRCRALADVLDSFVHCGGRARNPEAAFRDSVRGAKGGPRRRRRGRGARRLRGHGRAFGARRRPRELADFEAAKVAAGTLANRRELADALGAIDGDARLPRLAAALREDPCGYVRPHLSALRDLRPSALSALGGGGAAPPLRGALATHAFDLAPPRVPEQLPTIAGALGPDRNDGSRLRSALSAGFGYAYSSAGDALALQLGSRRSVLALGANAYPRASPRLRRAYGKRAGDLRRQLRRLEAAGGSAALALNTLPLDAVVERLRAQHAGPHGCWVSDVVAAAWRTLRETGDLYVFELFVDGELAALDVAHETRGGIFYVATRYSTRLDALPAGGFLLALASCGWLARNGAAAWDLGAVDASREMADKRGLTDDVDKVLALDAHRRARAAAAGPRISPDARVLVPAIRDEDPFRRRRRVIGVCGAAASPRARTTARPTASPDSPDSDSLSVALQGRPRWRRRCRRG